MFLQNRRDVLGDISTQQKRVGIEIRLIALERDITP
jgi:hypothetical protein